MLRLNSSSLDWALAQALNYGDTDMFPAAFEFQAIEADWTTVREWLARQEISQWNVRPHLRYLTPKHMYGYRVATRLDPLDFLVFTAFVHENGGDIEAARSPKSDAVVYSYRFAPERDGAMYDTSCNYQSFSQRSQELAGTGTEWVVLADIADFYPRMYHHRVENALCTCTSSQPIAKAFNRMLSGWSGTESYGIPVGPLASTLLAEITLSDVDDALLSENARYVRFNDDFRIFCVDRREAYERLAFLAKVLFTNHGLTLQQHKTRIMSVSDFANGYLKSPAHKELASLSEKLLAILGELGLTKPYEPFQQDQLSVEQRTKISELNLQGILREQVSREEIDIILTRFVLRRLAQMKAIDSVDLVLDNVVNLYPVIPDVARYVKSLSDLDATKKQEIGGKLLQLLFDSVTSHLEYHRMWLLSVFANDQGFDHKKDLVRVAGNWSDELTRREAILALGRSGQVSWFRMRKTEVLNQPPWSRRAFIYAASCLPLDEREHWYRQLRPRLDTLELAVAKWAEQNPIS